MGLAVAGCPGGGAGVGQPCDDTDGCASELQCVAGVCVPRCQRAPECGDGYACDADGLCRLAVGQSGDACTSEVQCSPGLACQIDGGTVDERGRLRASCTQPNGGRPAGATCVLDDDCRNGTCALGRCVDLCTETRDCAAGTACTAIPRVSAEADGALFDGCLQSRGAIAWTIPVDSSSGDILVPVPDAARSATVVFQIDDVAQKVGAQEIRAPSDDPATPSYVKPCEPAGDPGCTDVVATDQYFAQRLRHLPASGQSVLQIPSGTSAPLEAGAYRVRVASFRANGTPGSAIPHVTAVVKMDTAVILDVHFYFLDLEDHPCEAAFGDARLDATAATSASFFQTDFVGSLRSIFAGGGLALGETTYQDVLDHPDLDGLELDKAGALLALGAHDVGINVFFVRTLSPVGLQAFGPNPGPAGLGKTRQSGVVIALDTLCYRSWGQLARVTAHEIARYMGLYHNVELEIAQHPSWRDPIDDSDDALSNLMFFSELGGTELSAGQREILTKSAVLR